MMLSVQAQTPAPGLPKAAVRNVQDVHHGVKVDDPYRYFENVKDAEVAAWMKAHSDHAHKTLQALPGRAKILSSIQKFEDAASARVVQVARVPGDLYFYEKRGAKDNQFKLYVRKGLTGEEKLLLDPELLAQKTGKPHAINYFAPSPDGSHVAYGVSQAGSEDAVLHVMNVQSGKLVGKPVDRAQFGGVDWSPDGKAVFFNRLQLMKKGMPETEKYQRSLVWRMPLAGGMTKATAVFGMGVGGASLAAPELPFTTVTPDGSHAFGIVINGTQREWGIYRADGKAYLAGKPQWKRLASYSDEVTSMAYKDGKLYLKSHKGAPRSQVLMMDMANADISKAKVIVAQSERVITNIGTAADALYLEVRDGNVKKLFKRAYADDAQLVEVKLPVEGAFQLFGDEGGAAAVDSRLPGAIIDLQGWTRARQIYAVAADGNVTNTGLQPQGPYDAPADIMATEVKVKSHDGVMVPMSIIHKKDVKLDGNNPTLLYGYASYGITEEPFFSYGRLAWMDAGGVFAIANPRGSGVYGQDWYKAGFQTTKPNTWKDFIACAEFLIAQKYTTPAKLGILGGSAGGILVGRAMTERPDLFAAVVPAVGALDGIRFESTPNGVPNIPEFGTIKNETGFKALLAMSTYANIKDGVKYPAVLLTHGVNDPRVEVWQSTKAAARLMAASTSGKPVLMRLDYAAGHGVGNTKKQQQEERADIYSFLLWQMSVAEFQPK
jgi:prolyl oligopeptidase